MEGRMLWIALLVFFTTWKNADTRKIDIFEHFEIPVKGRISLPFPKFPSSYGNGPLLIGQEVFNLTKAILIREGQRVFLGGDMPESVPRLSRINRKLAEGSLLIRQEFFNLAKGILIREAQRVFLGGDMPESVSRLSRVNKKLVEGLSKILNTVPCLSEALLEKTVSKSGGRKFHGSSLGIFCNTCLEVSKQAEEVLSDTEMLETAVALAKSICNQLPSDLSAKCDRLVGTFIQEAVSMLQDYLSQDKLCIGTGLCNGNNNNDLQYKLGMDRNTPSLDAGDDSSCAMCEQFIKETTYYVSQNKTQSEVLAALQQKCSKLGVLGTKCISVVNYSAPLVFLEIATISPKEFCKKISICSDLSSLALNRKKNNCDVCKFAMLEIETHLKDPETKMKVIEMLLDGCKRVPIYGQECKKLVFEYGPLILTNLEKHQIPMIFALKFMCVNTLHGTLKKMLI